MRLRWLTAGESHGVGLIAVLDGMCSGVKIKREDIERDLAARRKGAGRSARQEQELDEFEILSGVRNGLTTGAPIALRIDNRVAGHEGFISRAFGTEADPRTIPRPGHADLAGALKRPGLDMRDVAERASARETAARTALGAIAGALIGALGVRVKSRVIGVGGVKADGESGEPVADSSFGTGDKAAEVEIEKRMIEAKLNGLALGGIFEVLAENVPPGLGDYTQWDRRLDGRLAQALMSIPAVKAVEIGEGIKLAQTDSSKSRDPIEPGLQRPTNVAGGLEGGVTNGMPLRIVGFVKPISGVEAKINSIDLATGERAEAVIERHDTVIARAAAVVGRAMVQLVLADAILERTGGETLAQVANSMTFFRENL